MPIEPVTKRQDVRSFDRARRKRAFRRTIGRGLAVALFGVLAVPVVTVFLEARDAARKAVCRAHMNTLSTALLMYTADYSERMPPANRWSDCLYDYAKNDELFRCTARPSLPGGFAFNRLLSTRPVVELNSGSLSPAIFESSIGILNASDELQSFITPHDKQGYVIYATGRVQAVSIAPSAAAGVRPPKPARRSGRP